MIWFMEISKRSKEELLLIKYSRIKHIILHIIHMIDVKEGFLQWLKYFSIISLLLQLIQLLKQLLFAGKRVTLPERIQEFANELQKSIFQKFQKCKLYSSFISYEVLIFIWGANLFFTIWNFAYCLFKINMQYLITLNSILAK